VSDRSAVRKFDFYVFKDRALQIRSEYVRSCLSEMTSKLFHVRPRRREDGAETPPARSSRSARDAHGS
jgi:hypothetical protein